MHLSTSTSSPSPSSSSPSSVAVHVTAKCHGSKIPALEVVSPLFFNHHLKPQLFPNHLSPTSEKKKQKKVPVSLLPYKNGNKFKKNSTHPTPFFSVWQKNLTIFQPLKSQTSRPMAAGPGVGGNCSFPKDSDSPGEGPRIDWRQGGQGFWLMTTPLWELTGSLKGLQVGYVT